MHLANHIVSWLWFYPEHLWASVDEISYIHLQDLDILTTRRVPVSCSNCASLDAIDIVRLLLLCFHRLYVC